jgi:hypothetical protein
METNPTMQWMHHILWKCRASRGSLCSKLLGIGRQQPYWSHEPVMVLLATDQGPSILFSVYTNAESWQRECSGTATLMSSARSALLGCKRWWPAQIAPPRGTRRRRDLCERRQDSARDRSPHGSLRRGASPASSDAKVASLGAPGSMTTAHAYHPPSTPFARCRTRRRASLYRGTNAQLLTIGLRILQLWSVDECSLQLTSSMVDLLLDGHLVGIIFFLECATFSHQAARHKEVTPILLLILPTRPSLISYLVAVDIPSPQ